MAAGEGIETVLSLRELLPQLPMIAGLSAAHLAAIEFPDPLRRLYVAFDDDHAGRAALAALTVRAVAAAIDIVPIAPERGDFNDDLRELGRARFAERLLSQLGARDAERFLVG